MPGTFATTPESYGMFYQWNRNVGWSATEFINSNGGTTWNNSMPTGTKWEKSNDPSPSGWRLPTREEQLTLLDTDKVEYEWTTENGINGGRFTDKLNGNSLFLPAAGNRYYIDGVQYDVVGSLGNYWSSILNESNEAYAYALYFVTYASAGSNGLMSGFSVRCVKDDSETSVTSTIANESAVLGYYSIMGQPLLQEPASGIYIIMYDNGETKKVMR